MSTRHRVDSKMTHVKSFRHRFRHRVCNRYLTALHESFSNTKMATRVPDHAAKLAFRRVRGCERRHRATACLAGPLSHTHCVLRSVLIVQTRPRRAGMLSSSSSADAAARLSRGRHIEACVLCAMILRTRADATARGGQRRARAVDSSSSSSHTGRRSRDQAAASEAALASRRRPGGSIERPRTFTRGLARCVELGLRSAVPDHHPAQPIRWSPCEARCGRHTSLGWRRRLGESVPDTNRKSGTARASSSPCSHGHTARFACHLHKNGCEKYILASEPARAREISRLSTCHPRGSEKWCTRSQVEW